MRVLFHKIVFSALLGLFSTTCFADLRLETSQIPAVMNQFFHYHIEKREMTPQIIRRAFKLYIENFDLEKEYLLESEVLPFLKISDSNVEKVISQYQMGRFDWFESLQRTIQKAIVRARVWRDLIIQEIIQQKIQDLEGEEYQVFAQSEKELFQRQKNKLKHFFAYHNARTPLQTRAKKSKAAVLFSRKVQRLENEYLFLDPNDKPLAKSKREALFSQKILKAMAKSLDAHTSFFTEEEASDMRISLEKQFEGVGIVLSEGIDGVVVADLIKNSPAEKSGKIAIQDLVVEINKQSVIDLPFEETLKLMKAKGSAGLALGLKRGNKQWTVNLKKEPIVLDEGRLSYTSEPYGSGIIGKLKLNSFYESGSGVNSEQDIRRAIRDLEKQGPLLGIVLDFRENAGGFLSQAVKVAGLFISSGVVVISKYGKNKVHYLRKVDTKSFYNGPLIILTSKLSASAAEIVAQALQDYGTAIIVGDERTYGKGSIQYQTVTDEKADLFFKVTIGKYYTVSGKSTQVDGVKADIVVPSIFFPYHIGEKFLEYPLLPDRVSPVFQDSLKDLDFKAKRWFQKNYLPHLQKKILFWRNMLPVLSENSAYRIKHSAKFQSFLKWGKAFQEQGGPPRNAKLPNYGDLQMIQAVHILKDMIYFEAKNRKETAIGLQNQRQAIQQK